MALAVVSLSGCWLQPGFGPARQSYNRFESTLTAANVDTLTEAWSVDAHYGGQPLVSGDRIVLGGTRSTSSGRVAGVQAFERRTGAPAWERDLAVSDNPLLPLPAGLAFSGDSIWSGVLPAGTPPAWDTRLDRLDPADGTTSESLVQAASLVTNFVPAGPILAYTTVDASLASGSLMVRDASTFATRWTATLPALASGLVVAHGQLYVTAGTSLYAFAVNGCGASVCDPTWGVTVPESTRASVVSATDDGRVLVTAEGMISGAPGVDPVGSSSLDAYRSNGTLAWRAVTTAQPASFGIASIRQVAVADDVVYAAGFFDGQFDRTWYLRAYSTAGCSGAPNCQPLWQVDLGPDGASTFTSGLVVAGGVVYLGVGDEVRAFDATGCGASTCTPLVTVPVNGTVGNLSVTFGRLFVTSTASDQPQLTAFTPSP